MSGLICKVAEPSDNEKLDSCHINYYVYVCFCPTSVVHSVLHYPVYVLDVQNIPLLVPSSFRTWTRRMVTYTWEARLAAINKQLVDILGGDCVLLFLSSATNIIPRVFGEAIEPLTLRDKGVWKGKVQICSQTPYYDTWCMSLMGWIKTLLLSMPFTPPKRRCMCTLPA